MKAKIKNLFKMKHLSRAMDIFIGSLLVYMMFDSFTLHQPLGIGGYGLAFAWFVMYQLQEARIEIYRDAYNVAKDGWSACLDAWTESTNKMTDALTTIEAENVELKKTTPKARQGRTLGLK